MNEPTENRGRRWWPALLCAAVGAAVFQFFGNASFGYIKSKSLFWWWGYQWVNPESETEHGLLILALSGWLVWRNLRQSETGDRSSEIGPAKEISELRSSNSDLRAERAWPAAVAMVAGLALHLVGFAGQQARMSVLGLLLFTWGVLRLGGGRRWGRAAMFPLCLMVLAIPISAVDVGFPLRLMVIKTSAKLAHVAGIGVLQNGTFLVSPDGRYNYDVAAACSGVRSLVAMLALSLLIGYVYCRSWWRRAGLVLLCFPLIYVGNVARITAIIFAAQWGGPEWGQRAHAVMGWGVFVIVLGGIMLAVGALQRWWPEAPRGRGAEMGDRKSEVGTEVQSSAGVAPAPADAGGTPALRRAWLVAGVVAVLAVAEMLFLARLASLPPRGAAGVKLAADGQNPVELPVFLGTEWIGQRAEVTAAELQVLPPDTGYSRKLYKALANPGQHVLLSIVLSGRDRSSIHRPELCVVGQGWTIRAVTEHRFAVPNPKGGTFPATILHVQRELQTPRGTVVVPQLIAYWFVGGDTVEPTYWKRLARDAWNRVVHARADRWAYVLMQTDARDGDPAALARMQEVLDQTLPAFQPPGRGK